MVTDLATYDRMKKALVEATRIDEAKEILDQAEGLITYARRIGDAEAEARIAVIKLNAMFHIGRISSGLDKAPVIPGAGNRRLPTGGKSGKTATLRKAKLSTSAANRCELVYSIGEAAFQHYINDKAARKKPVTITEVYSRIVKKSVRAKRELDLANLILALPSKKYGVIVEDYEWDQKTWSEDGKDRHASNHYPTSTDAHAAAEIVERTKQRFECAAEDCVLFMWATVPHLAIALDVLRLRGFAYKSNYAWGKDKSGTGYWNRNRHEHLLIGVKGSIPCPAPGDQWDSLVMAPVGKHSAKPECFLEMIEGYFPNIPKIELNRRGAPRPGWDAWGNEAEEQAA